MSGRIARAALIIRAPVVLCALVVATACSDTLGVTAEAVQSHRAQWEATGITTYSYDYHKQCECLSVEVQPVRIDVEAGSVVRVALQSGAQPLGSLTEGLFPTIDALFDQIDEAAGKNAASLVVTYDRALGYPTLISVDYRRDVVDDEYTIRASNLVPR